jgi:hypothetical protein
MTQTTGLMKRMLTRLKPGRKCMVAVLLLSFFIGYNGMVMHRQCAAQSVPGPISNPFPISGNCIICLCPACCGCAIDPCDWPGMSATMRTAFATMFDQTLTRLTYQVPPWPGPQGGAGQDGFISGMTDLLVAALMTRLNDIELNMIAWWDTMWFYNLRPAMQAMTEQINTAATQQVENFQAGMDAFQENETNNVNNNTENKNAQQMRPSENACVGAMAASGYGRSSNFAKAMRMGWQEETSVVKGTNKRNVPGYRADESAASQLLDDANLFEQTFCDPNDNAGYNVCQGTPDPAYYNADTTVTKTLYNKLTIQVDDATNGTKEAKAVASVINNLTNDPTGDTIPTDVLQTPQGQEKWLDRRGYLARYNALRSVPQIIAGWRMPGSRMGQWVRELREDSKVPPGDISDNPSYREILHAVSIDRFNNGKFANNLIGDQSAIDMEKLTLSTYYLMQLRDYYELLERQALTLAVQVALMVETIPRPHANQSMR